MTLIASIVTGVTSSAATIAALKVEINWLKKIQEEIKARLDKHDKRLSELEKGAM